MNSVATRRGATGRCEEKTSGTDTADDAVSETGLAKYVPQRSAAYGRLGLDGGLGGLQLFRVAADQDDAHAAARELLGVACAAGGQAAPARNDTSVRNAAARVKEPSLAGLPTAPVHDDAPRPMPSVAPVTTAHSP